MNAFRITILAFISPIVAAMSASAVVISEVAPSGGDGQPPYIELTITQPVTSLELLVLNGSPYREQDIRERVAMAVAPGTAVIVVHQGDWVGDRAFDTRLVGVASLDAGGLGLGAARRLVLFDTSNGATVGPVVPPLSQWASTPELPPRLDVVSYSINGWAVNDSLGEPVISLDNDEAAARVRSGTGFSDTFVTQPLSPGLINPRVEMPEPSTALLVTLAGFTIGRRGR